MFIYEIILKDERAGTGPSLNEYALTRRVIPVSPNSFYAYLQAIAYGLRGLRIEERAQEILGHLLKLHNDFDKFRNEFEAIGNALNSSQKHFTQAERKLNKIDARLTTFTTLDKPVSKQTLFPTKK